MRPLNLRLQSLPPPGQIKQRVCYFQHTPDTAKSYLDWVSNALRNPMHGERDMQSIPGCHIRWHGRHGKTTHPRDMGAKQVKAFFDGVGD